MVTLTVSRDSGYADRLRAYAIILDGREIGRLRDGETREFHIDPGNHEISMKIDWCGSETLKVTAAEGEALSFRASSNLRGLNVFLGVWYVFFARHSYLRIERRP